MTEQLALFGSAVARPRLKLDAAESLRRKVEGQAQAAASTPEWAELIVAEARTWLKAQRRRGLARVTIEEFRAQARNQPKSHKAWGLLPGMLVRAGLIEGVIHPDGSPVYKRAAAPKTHAHHVRIWEITA